MHCFEYGREQAPELEKYCEKIYYYPRKRQKKRLLSSYPYIVISRQSDALIKNLIKDNHPIIFEGLHTTYSIDHKSLSNRYKIIRTHNIEHNYYRSLAASDQNLLKKLFFHIESQKLKRYEKKLRYAQAILAISKNDYQYLKNKYTFPHSSLLHISAFHPFDELKIQEGNGKYILYHGNLSVSENIRAAVYLIKQVLSKLQYPVVIAGRNPASSLHTMSERYKHIRLVKNPTDKEMKKLVEEAHINILPTFQATGIKLKLLHALFKGRHCIVNSPMVDNTGLENSCIICDTPDSMIMEINRLWSIPFSQDDIAYRKQILIRDFSNQVNAAELINSIVRNTNL